MDIVMNKKEGEMNRTKIEWVKNPDGTQGYTWNPITGCLNGCPYCYARKLANGRLKERYLMNDNISRELCWPQGELNKAELDKALADPFYPRFWEERLNEPYTYGRNFAQSGRAHKGIFVCDMGELFGDWVPRKWQEKIFYVIEGCPQHRFYLLTKQPQNLIKFSPFPDNCWVGVTATDVKQYRAAREGLHSVKATIKFISFEPLLEHIPVSMMGSKYSADIAWPIIGAQTQPYKPPKIEWVEEIVRAAGQAGMPVFLKNNLYPLLKIGMGKSIFHIGGFGELRQEMPEVKG